MELKEMTNALSKGNEPILISRSLRALTLDYLKALSEEEIREIKTSIKNFTTQAWILEGWLEELVDGNVSNARELCKIFKGDDSLKSLLAFLTCLYEGDACSYILYDLRVISKWESHPEQGFHYITIEGLTENSYIVVDNTADVKVAIVDWLSRTSEKGNTKEEILANVRENLGNFAPAEFFALSPSRCLMIDELNAIAYELDDYNDEE